MIRTETRGLFVTGIGTGVGKTIVSAIIAEAHKAEYWKPIQSGDLQKTDTCTIQSLTSNVRVHPERYKLKLPAAPHIGALHDGIEIDLDELTIPMTSPTRPLVVEGAGGVLVPLNPRALMIDLIAKINFPTIIVSQNYLGSINHTLLSVQALQTRGINIKGVIFVRESNPDAEELTISFSKARRLGHIPMANHLDRNFIQAQASMGWIHDLL